MPIVTSEIKNILLVSLTNIGDVLLTLPVADILFRDFPKADLSIIIGPKAESLFTGNTKFKEIIIFEKGKSFKELVQWIRQFKGKKYDLIVDLRNSALPFFLRSKYRTSFFDRKNSKIHMKNKHLQRLSGVHPFVTEQCEPKALEITDAVKEKIRNLQQDHYLESDQFLIVAPGAASSGKRWSVESFAKTADEVMASHHMKAVFIGHENDNNIINKITKQMHNDAINLAGKLSLIEVAALMTKTRFVLANDSAPMHLASRLNIPVIALFGPSDPNKYGPWGTNGLYLKSEVQDSGYTHINLIKVELVLEKINQLLSTG